MVLNLTEAERKALIWQDGDCFEIRSGTFCITQTQSFPQSSGASGLKRIHAVFDESVTGASFDLEMTIGGDIPNGPTLLLSLCRGEQMSPYALISMVNRAWVHQTPLSGVSLYRTTNRYARFAEPPLVYALGPFAQLAWMIGKGLFTNHEEEEREIMTALHRLLHRIAANHTHYWEGGGGSTAGKL